MVTGKKIKKSVCLLTRVSGCSPNVNNALREVGAQPIPAIDPTSIFVAPPSGSDKKMLSTEDVGGYV
jgi:hypothetical protein